MNVAIEYQYRDAGNWKQPGRIVVANPDQLDPSDAQRRMRAACEWEAAFIASRVGFPNCFFDGGRNEDDVECHELCELKPCSDPVSDPRTLMQVVREFEERQAEGWWLGMLGE